MSLGGFAQNFGTHLLSKMSTSFSREVIRKKYGNSSQSISQPVALAEYNDGFGEGFEVDIDEDGDEIGDDVDILDGEGESENDDKDGEEEEKGDARENDEEGAKIFHIFSSSILSSCR